MTRKEAYQRLDIAEDADIQEVRRKFAAMHSDYRMRIDNAPTPHLRQLFEQQLEQIKEAYSFLNGSEGIDDTTELPRMKRTFYEKSGQKGNENEGTNGTRQTNHITLSEAYDYFGLSGNEEGTILNRKIDSKIKELKIAITNQTLPTAKKLYEEELYRAENLKRLILEDRQRSQEARIREEKDSIAKEKAWREREETEKKQEEQARRGKTKPEQIHTKKKSKTPTYIIIGLVAVILSTLLIHSLLSPDQTLYTPYLEQAIEAAKNKNSEAFDTALQHFSEAIKRDGISPASLSKKNMDLYTEALCLGLDPIHSAVQLSNDAAANALKFVRYEIENKPEKMYLLGRFYDVGTGEAKNDSLAIEWYEKAAAKEDKKAMVALGIAYLWDLGNEESAQKARYWLEKGAAQGSSDAMVGLGMMYKEGFGDVPDFAKAKYWYEKAANQENTESMIFLAELFLEDNNGLSDTSKAKYWYMQAAEKGDERAMNRIAVLYYNGTILAKNYSKAKYWFEKAAEKGMDKAMVNIAKMYDDGIGVDKDETKATYWYEKAAEKGGAWNMTNLAERYFYGLGVEKDYAKAADWYEKAAKKGNKIAMQNLSWLYRNGKGVTIDDVKADYWDEKSKARE